MVGNIIFVGCITRNVTHSTNVTGSVVCVTVYVEHMGELCKNGWTDQDAVWVADLCETMY